MGERFYFVSFYFHKAELCLLDVQDESDLIILEIKALTQLYICWSRKLKRAVVKRINRSYK